MKNVIEIYNKIAEDYAATYDVIDSPEDMIFPDEFLKHLSNGSHIIDLGCGTGFSAGYFQKHGMNVEGVDLSSSMIAIAKRNYPDIQFSINDMRTFEPKVQVDAVWAGYCLFHLSQQDFEATINKIRRYLKPDGIFGFVMQEGSGEIMADEPFLPGEKIYIHLYTLEELEVILKRYNFSIVKHQIKAPKDPKEFSYSKLLVIAR